MCPGPSDRSCPLAEVNRALSRSHSCREDVIDSMTRGEFLALQLDKQDSLERPRKYSTFLLTRYPVSVDPSKAKELPGVYSARRFHQNGAPINRLVITWSLPEAPPPPVAF